jgi:hypothetical protein
VVECLVVALLNPYSFFLAIETPRFEFMKAENVLDTSGTQLNAVGRDLKSKWEYLEQRSR